MQTFDFILGLRRSTVEPQWWRRVKVMEWEKQKRHRETSEKVGKVTGWKGLGGQYWKNTGKRGGSNWQWALGHEWGTVWQWASEDRGEKGRWRALPFLMSHISCHCQSSWLWLVACELGQTNLHFCIWESSWMTGPYHLYSLLYCPLPPVSTFCPTQNYERLPLQLLIFGVKRFHLN